MITAQETITIVAAGDIACDPLLAGGSSLERCQSDATAALIETIKPDAVLALGDIQYEVGLSAAFQAIFDKSWGRFKELIYPAPGNHDYLSGGTGYFNYFGDRAGHPNHGYYSFNRGSWHFISLNSNCDEVGGCAIGSPQLEWLQSDLATYSSKCTLAYWHHPLFSSGKHGNHSFVHDFFATLDEGGVDLVLVGHDHHYERFALQTAEAQADPQGIRQFVVGTGGRSLYPLQATQANSEIRNNQTFGVLKLELEPDSYSWGFISIEGASVIDEGKDFCH